MPPLSIPGLNSSLSGLSEFDDPETIPWFTVSGTGRNPIANTAYVYRKRYPRSRTISGLKIGVVTASGNVDVGLYSSADSGTTLTRLTSSGSVVVAGTNAVQTVNFTAPVVVTPGIDYWFAVAYDNITTSVSGLGGNNFIGFDEFKNAAKATSFPLPATISGHSASSNFMWLKSVGS